MRKYFTVVYLNVIFSFIIANMVLAQNTLTIYDAGELKSCKAGLRFVLNGLHVPIYSQNISKDNKDELRKIAELFNQWSATILLEGHADVSSTPKLSYKNSIKRAKLIEKLLLKYGIPTKQLIVTAIGELDPPFLDTPQSTKNQTVVFQILFCPFSKKVSPIVRYSLKFATATRGGTYYASGRVMSAMWNDKLKDRGINIEAIQTQGSPHNLELLRKGEADLAISTFSVAEKAYKDGIGSFKGTPYENLTAIGFLWDNVQHFVISSEYLQSTNVSDLQKIQKFCVGREKSSNAFAANIILDRLGIDKIDRIDCGGYNETVQALHSKKYQGASFAGGVPVRALEDLLSDNLFTLLEFSNEQVLKGGFPSYTIPANTYQNRKRSIRTLTEPNIIAVNAQLDDQIVYLLLEKLFDNIEALGWGHKALKSISFNEAFGQDYGGKRRMPIPLHSAVKRFISKYRQ